MKNGWIIDKYGAKRHYVDDIIHNDNGPAIILANGTQSWCQHGKVHREDGPAVDYCDDDKAWYYNGKCVGYSWHGYSQRDFNNWKKYKAFI